MDASKLLRTAGIAAAAAFTAYLFDPDLGRTRRARLADQAGARIRSVAARAQARAEYQRGVMRGVKHDVTAHFREDRHFDDDTLRQKVRSEAVGRWDGPAETLEIDVDNGVVTLRGSAPKGAAARLIELTSDVEGVHAVVDEIGASGS